MLLTLFFLANSWIGYAFCYLVIMLIYYTDTWKSLSFPMLSSSIFGEDGRRYNQTAVFGTHFVLNQTALEEVGLPYLTGSNAWANLTANLAVSLALDYAINAHSAADRGVGCPCLFLLGRLCQRFVQDGMEWDPAGPTLSSDEEVQRGALVLVLWPTWHLFPRWYVFVRIPYLQC